MLKYIIAYCGGCGISHLITFVISGNLASIGLLGKYQFEEWGRMPGIVVSPEACHDHLVLGRKINP